MADEFNIRYQDDDGLPRRISRRELGDARSISREGMRVELMEQEIFGLGQRNIVRGTMLDLQRRIMVGDDPSLNAIAADIELETLLQAKRIQQGLFRDS